MTLTEAMAQATKTILKAMQADLLYLDNRIPAYPAGYPLTWDINNGMCEDWGMEVENLCPDVWGDWLEDDDGTDYRHYAVTNGLLWYDAECPDGVADWHNLPMIAARIRGTDNPRVLPLPIEETA